MKIITRFSLLHVLLTILPLLTPLLFSDATAREVPELKQRVNDLAGLLLPTTVTQIENGLRYIEQEDSTQIVVLIITSLEGDNLEEFSIRVAEEWKIGQKGLDNGALLLISKEDRKVRIETGYGLEGLLTDLKAGRIIRNIILPQFRKGNFDQGVIDGVSAMIATVKGEFSPDELPQGTKSSDDHMGFFIMLFFVLSLLGNLMRKKKVLAAISGGVVAPALGALFLSFSWKVFFILIPIGMIGGLLATSLGSAKSGRSRRGRRRGQWNGGGIGYGGRSGGFGGGFSGGGGGFGGGGASGGW